MRWGLLIAVVVGVGGLAAMVTTFITGASPYVTVAEAKVVQGDSLHLAGEIIQGTLQANPSAGVVRFQIKDDNGDFATIVYNGPPPSNMNEATRVVAIGKMKGEEFHSRKLLLKCPSKYESEGPAAKA